LNKFQFGSKEVHKETESEEEEFTPPRNALESITDEAKQFIQDGKILNVSQADIKIKITLPKSDIHGLGFDPELKSLCPKITVYLAHRPQL
jgi:hypothetical protein